MIGAGALVQAFPLEMAPGCSYRSSEAAIEAAGGKARRQEEGMVAWRLVLHTPEATSGRMVSPLMTAFAKAEAFCFAEPLSPRIQGFPGAENSGMLLIDLTL